MDGDRDINARLEAAFCEIVMKGPDRVRTALEKVTHTDPSLARQLEPFIKPLLTRQQARVPTAPVAVPALPDRFRVIRSLGSGGFGAVYQAIDTRFDAEVAVKVLHAPESSSLRRFKDEFTTLSTIARHDNLVKL